MSNGSEVADRSDSRSTNVNADDGANSNADANGGRTRRTVLQTVGAGTIAGVGFSASASASSGSSSEYADEYSSVVNVVDAGADPSGNEPITPVLNDIREDDTLLVFPEGRYYVDSQFRFTGFEKFGVVGENATLVPASFHDFDGPQYRMFRLGTLNKPGRNLRFEGFDVDQTAPVTGIRVIEAYASASLEVRDVTVHGQHDTGTWGPGLFNMTDPDGSGIVERFRAPDGGKWSENTPYDANMWRGPTGIIANENRGSLEFKDCVLGAFPGNGLYAVHGGGPIGVNGGLYRNSATAIVRVGGDNSEITGCTVEADETRPEDPSQRGIRVEKGDGIYVHDVTVKNTSPMSNSHAISVQNTADNTRIENATIEIRGDEVNHGIVVQPEAGKTSIIDSEIVHDVAGGYAIWIRDSDTDAPVMVENVAITDLSGDAAGLRDAIRCERDGCEFNAVDIDQSERDGADRNAIANTSDGSIVYNSKLRASLFPYVDNGTNNLVRDSDLESTGDHCAAARYSCSENTTFEKNRLVDGIRDHGEDDATTSGCTYE